jgi:hypothetical protein
MKTAEAHENRGGWRKPRRRAKTAVAFENRDDILNTVFKMRSISAENGQICENGRGEVVLGRGPLGVKEGAGEGVETALVAAAESALAAALDRGCVSRDDVGSREMDLLGGAHPLIANLGEP